MTRFSKKRKNEKKNPEALGFSKIKLILGRIVPAYLPFSCFQPCKVLVYFSFFKCNASILRKSSKLVSLSLLNGNVQTSSVSL